MKGIKTLINKIRPDTYLKFKVNHIKEQSVKSDNCGWFSCRFLMNRFEGYPFKDVTHFSEVGKNENEIKEFKHKIQKKFGYI